MAAFNLANYDTVDSRIHKFWEDHPDGRILTDIIAHSPTDYIVTAAVYRTPRDQRPVSTGFAQETVKTTGVNATSALENCETSAIGRALANLGYSTRGTRPSREEMEKVQRYEAADETLRPEQDADELANWALRLAAANTVEQINELAGEAAQSRLTGEARDTLRQFFADRRTQLAGPPETIYPEWQVDGSS